MGIKEKRLIKRLKRLTDKTEMPVFYPEIDKEKYRWVIIAKIRGTYDFAASQYLGVETKTMHTAYGLVAQKGKPYASPYIALPEDKLQVAMLSFIMDDDSHEFIDLKTGEAFNKKQIITRHNGLGLGALLNAIIREK